MQRFRWIGAALRREGGQTFAEYGLILALIAGAAVLALTGIGSSLADFVSQVADKL